MRRRYIAVLLVVLGLLPLLGFHAGLLVRPDIEPRVAMVLGAGIIDNERPSGVLKNRLDQAVELYAQGRVESVLVSGDNRERYYDEPKVMREYLVGQGVAREDIVADFAGRRTVDSCWRARNVFGVERAYVITQNFHLPRATYLCRMVGIEVVAQEAKNASYRGGVNGYIRETLASWVALYDSLTYTPETQGDGTERQLSN